MPLSVCIRNTRPPASEPLHALPDYLHHLQSADTNETSIDLCKNASYTCLVHVARVWDIMHYALTEQIVFSQLLIKITMGVIYNVGKNYMLWFDINKMTEILKNT